MLDLVGSGWSSPAQAPPPDIVPSLPDQLLHPLLPDVLRLCHPLLLLRIDVTGLRSAKK
jgi:hypothetical protein